MRSRRSALRSLCLGALGAPLLASLARAQDAPLGWTEAPPSVLDAHVVAVAIGAAHDDDGPLAAARLAARRRGHARGVARLDHWADDALARSGAGPREAQAVHDAIASATQTARVRARADGSAVVEVRCPLSALRDAFDHPALPWHR
jgi:hypothetical protein